MTRFESTLARASRQQRLRAAIYDAEAQVATLDCGIDALLARLRTTGVRPHARFSTVRIARSVYAGWHGHGRAVAASSEALGAFGPGRSDGRCPPPFDSGSIRSSRTSRKPLSISRPLRCFALASAISVCCIPTAMKTVAHTPGYTEEHSAAAVGIAQIVGVPADSHAGLQVKRAGWLQQAAAARWELSRAVEEADGVRDRRARFTLHLRHCEEFKTQVSLSTDPQPFFPWTSSTEAPKPSPCTDPAVGPQQSPCFVHAASGS